MNIRKRRGAGNRQNRSQRNKPAKQANRGIFLYGAHPVAAALDNPARRCIALTATAAALKGLGGLTGRDDLSVTVAMRDEVGRRLDEGAVHQGLALEVAPLPRLTLEDICDVETAPRIVVLDRVNDPQNLGAVIRAAAAFSAGAVIIPDRHAPDESGALAKAASGTLEIMPLIRVANIARAIEILQRRGYWCLGLDGGAKQTLASAKPDGPVALVLGAEGAGLRRLTKDRCDALVRLPISDAVESLNLATAAAVALYAISEEKK